MTYNAALRKAVTDPSDRAALRRRLNSFFLVQLLAGTVRERNGIMAFSFRFIMTITIVVAPIAILVLVQLIFLPYHSEVVTWWHRIAIILDFFLIWMFWHSILRARGAVRFPRLRQNPLALVTSFVVIAFSTFVVTYPGEAIDGNRLVWLLDHVKLPLAGDYRPFSEVLFHGPVNMVTGHPRSLFSNVFVLPNEVFVDSEKIDRQQRSLVLRGRDLRGAILFGADLRKADFTGSNLTGARFESARLAGAKFDCNTSGRAHGPSASSEETEESWMDDGCTWLRHSSFNLADLSGASFNRARLEDTQFGFATLKETSFEGAHLQHANFIFANLQKASFDKASLYGATVGTLVGQANLQGASFKGAHWPGARLLNSDLSGATFDGAQMPAAIVGDSTLIGASFAQADLSLAVFSQVNLQGATLNGASMRGINMTGVLLQGADLRGVDARDATLIWVHVWRASIDPEPKLSCSILSLERSKVEPTDLSNVDSDKQIDDGVIDARKSMLGTYIDNADLKQSIERLDRIKGTELSSDDKSSMDSFWSGIIKSNRCSATSRRAQLSDTIKSTACRSNDGDYQESPYVAQAIVERKMIDGLGPDAAGVAKFVLDPRLCPGAAQMNEASINKLKVIAARVR